MPSQLEARNASAHALGGDLDIQRDRSIHDEAQVGAMKDQAGQDQSSQLLTQVFGECAHDPGLALFVLVGSGSGDFVGRELRRRQP